MTKKHFEAAATIVRNFHTPTHEGMIREMLADSFVRLFEQFSPNFNRERFLKACGL